METNLSNINLIVCDCGSDEFEMVTTVRVTKFFDNEYQKGKGFINRRPSFLTETVRLKCIKCNKFYKDSENA
jgi:hypothetical protein